MFILRPPISNLDEKKPSVFVTVYILQLLHNYGKEFVFKIKLFCSCVTAQTVGCRGKDYITCRNGICLPNSVQCDGVAYCTDGSTNDILCGTHAVQVQVQHFIKSANKCRLYC